MEQAATELKLAHDAALPPHDAAIPPHDAALPPHDAALPPHDAALPPPQKKRKYRVVNQRLAQFKEEYVTGKDLH